MKMIQNVKRYIVVSFLCLSVMLGLLKSMDTQAATQKGSITLKFEEYAGADFKLYRVAEQYTNENNEKGFKLIAPFDGYSVDVMDRNAAETLQRYVERDQIEAMQSGTTNAQGEILFDNLEYGAYLILGSDYSTQKADGTRENYRMNPVFVSLPGKEEGSGNWINDITVYAKYINEEAPEYDKELSVQKVWDDNNATDRPNSITVELLENGVVIQDVILSAENNWSYKWTNLNNYATYKVVEKVVPSGYTVSTKDVGINKTVITNKKDSPPEHGSTQDIPPEDGSTENGPSKKPDNSNHKLPQTGQLWWPIGLMLCAGLLFLIIGVRLGKDRED